MKMIKRLSAEIAGNIEEARDKIKTAYGLKTECPEAAAWYREMANAHIAFNTNGHALVKKMIEAYKASEEYKRKPEYAEGMIAAYSAMHDEMMEKTAEVRAMIEGYK